MHFYSYETSRQEASKHHDVLQQESRKEMEISPNSPDKIENTLSATEAMLKQPSSFVDGEKHLKRHLLKLKERQEKGIDKGVKHLTVWKGKDVPVWEPKDGSTVEFDDDDVVEIDEPASEIDLDDSSFPKPTDITGDDSASICLQPAYGSHRPNVDAVFAMAEGYDLKIYLQFLQSLRNTGFDGDVVLSVSSSEHMKEGVEQYLMAQKNIVLYLMDWDCRNSKGSITSGSEEGMNLCQIKGLYKTNTIDSLEDPRIPRPIATSRYELYWIWSTFYNDSSMIMLIDSRDTYFQSNPFVSLQRNTKDISKSGGILHFFAENAEATTLGKSPFNSRWLERAYGTDVKKYFEQPVICSGSTMGEKRALEIYLRAMVAEFDNTKCILKGCDQGFHNYLYYSKKMETQPRIKEIKVYKQGEGVINNLAALRKQTLEEQHVLDKNNNVLNWDGSLSPVAHQVDRDDKLRIAMNTKKREYLSIWTSTQRSN